MQEVIHVPDHADTPNTAKMSFCQHVSDRCHAWAYATVGQPMRADLDFQLTQPLCLASESRKAAPQL